MKVCAANVLFTFQWPWTVISWPFCIFFAFMFLLVLCMMLSVCFCFPCYLAGLCGKRRTKLHGRKTGSDFVRAFLNALWDVLCSNRPDYDYIFHGWQKHGTLLSSTQAARVLEEGRYKVESLPPNVALVHLKQTS